MNVSEALQTRYSVRGYKTDPVPEVLIREVFDTGVAQQRDFPVDAEIDGIYLRTGGRHTGPVNTVDDEAWGRS